MKIERYILLHFDNLKQPKEKYQIFVPLDAKFLGLNILHDGIYTWYTISEIIPGDHEDTKIEEFAIVLPGKSIPENTRFICILDTIVQTSSTEQGVLVFPIFKFNN